MTHTADVFVSYAHRDNANSNNEISKIVEELRREVDLISGGELRVFFDKTQEDVGIEWGDAWEQAISDGIESAAILLPFLTPTYFTRSACRLEYRQFEESGGRVLPIRFVAFDEIEGDEIYSSATQLQWEDWSELRTLDATDPGRRKAIQRMATRLVTFTEGSKESTATETNARRDEIDQIDEIADDPGSDDLIADAEAAIDEIPSELELLTSSLQGINAALHKGAARVQRSRSFGDRTRAYRAINKDIAEDLVQLEGASMRLETRILEADPGIKVLRTLHNDELPDDFDSNLATVTEQFRQMSTSSKMNQEVSRELAQRSRDLRDLSQIFQRVDARLETATATFEAWMPDD